MTNGEYADYRGTNMPQNKGENMYERQKRDDECYVIIKRPCSNRQTSNFPPEIKFDDRREDFYEDNWQENDFYDWDEGMEQRRFHQNNRPCKCNCHNERPCRPCRPQRPRRHCCCFNIFRCC